MERLPSLTTLPEEDGSEKDEEDEPSPRLVTAPRQLQLSSAVSAPASLLDRNIAFICDNGSVTRVGGGNAPFCSSASKDLVGKGMLLLSHAPSFLHQEAVYWPLQT